MKSLPKSADDFWRLTQAQWKSTPIKQRNFLKSIGMEPDEVMSRHVWELLQRLPHEQKEFILENNQTLPIEGGEKSDEKTKIRTTPTEGWQQ